MQARIALISCIYYAFFDRKQRGEAPGGVVSGRQLLDAVGAMPVNRGGGITLGVLMGARAVFYGRIHGADIPPPLQQIRAVLVADHAVASVFAFAKVMVGMAEPSIMRR